MPGRGGGVRVVTYASLYIIMYISILSPELHFNQTIRIKDEQNKTPFHDID